MSKVIQYVRELKASDITASQLDEFAALLAATPEASERNEAVTFFLRRVTPRAEQVVALSKSDAIRNDLGLLQLLKRHARSEAFRLSHESEKERLSKPWAIALEILRAATGFAPPAQKRPVAP